MSQNDEPMITAQVVLRPATGRTLTGHEEITRETLHEFLPDPQMAHRVAAAFADSGYEVGPVVGVSFSISARPAVIEQHFRVKLPLDQDGRLDFEDHTRRRGFELPLDALPPSLAEQILSISFGPPADLFGPRTEGSSS